MCQCGNIGEIKLDRDNQILINDIPALNFELSVRPDFEFNTVPEHNTLEIKCNKCSKSIKGW